jgi:opine dehydrogenase
MANITIIGIGHGGYAVAADMTLAGHDVTFYVSKKYENRVGKLFEDKTITLKGPNRNGLAKLSCITSDPETAFKNDIIMTVLPSYAQESFAEEVAPFIRPGHKLFLVPGSTGGSLVVAKKLHEAGKLNGVKIAEMHTLPYASRKHSDSSVEIILEAKALFFSAFPSKHSKEMFDIMKGFYPYVVLQNDVLETALNNGNAISHPAPMVLNAGYVDNSFGTHYHYKNGISPSVARVLEKMDQERKQILEALGYDFISTKDRIVKMDYAPVRDSLYESYRDSQIFSSLQGPNDLSNRYLTEDTAYALVFFSLLANRLNIMTPTIDSIINLAGALMNEDYFRVGRNLDDVGFGHFDKADIKTFLREGYAEA